MQTRVDAALTRSYDNADKTSEKGNLPAPVEDAVTMLLGAVGDRGAVPGKGLDIAALNTLLDFAMQPGAATEKALPAKRDPGYGIFYRSQINAPLEKLLRDARIYSIFEGTNQVQRQVIGKTLLG